MIFFARKSSRADDGEPTDKKKVLGQLLGQPRSPSDRQRGVDRELHAQILAANKYRRLAGTSLSQRRWPERLRDERAARAAARGPWRYYLMPRIPLALPSAVMDSA